MMEKEGQDMVSGNRGGKAIAVLFIALVVSLSFFLGYMVGKTFAPEKVIYKNPLPETPQAQKINPPAPSKGSELPEDKNVSEEKRIADKDKQLKDILMAEGGQQKIEDSRPSNGERARDVSSPKDETKREKENRAKRYYYSIQVGAFKERSGAVSLERRLKGKGYSVRVISPDHKGRFYKVRVGMFEDKASAEAMALKLARSERLKPVVVREND